jgi:predicted nucleic acid-binding protein
LIIIDTGPLVAAAGADDQDHDRCVAMFGGARQTRCSAWFDVPVASQG